MIESNEVKERQVPAQMENLKGRLSELEISIVDIKARFSSVLRDDWLDTSEKAIKAVKALESLVPLADDIRICANRINRLNIEVSTLLSELQL